MAAATPALMVQGTASNCGKSLVAAGLCRVLAREGVRVAPFKAQNMSNNSHVTLAGEEIGRAQALQARAAFLEPEARMNPVLLKPTTDLGSQVVVMGKPRQTLTARDYFARKPELWTEVTAAYDSLAADHEAVVIEGAGSPAEINLQAHDIVNMAMARHAEAPVLLVADIDRGGAFAHLVGTHMLVPDADRGRIKAFVLNKFRGDPALLGDALDKTTTLTGVPFLGVVPWLEALGLPDEDSVSLKQAPGAGVGHADIVIACPDLPRLSNASDLDPLRLEPDLALVLARRPEDLAGADLVVLPGSKSTAADLAWLRETGLAEAVTAHARAGGRVLGVCGGYQMLGLAILDPHGLETADASVPGLGLLPLTTTLEQDKRLRRSTFTTADGHRLVGYEIHHGQTRPTAELEVWLRDERGEAAGFGHGGLHGCYLHGLFDHDAFRRDLLNGLRAAKGLAPLPVQARYDLEPGLERLADTLQRHLDLTGLKALMGL